MTSRCGLGGADKGDLRLLPSEIDAFVKGYLDRSSEQQAVRTERPRCHTRDARRLRAEGLPSPQRRRGPAAIGPFFPSRLIRVNRCQPSSHTTRGLRLGMTRAREVRPVGDRPYRRPFDR